MKKNFLAKTTLGGTKKSQGLPFGTSPGRPWDVHWTSDFKSPKWIPSTKKNNDIYLNWVISKYHKGFLSTSQRHIHALRMAQEPDGVILVGSTDTRQDDDLLLLTLVPVNGVNCDPLQITVNQLFLDQMLLLLVRGDDTDWMLFDGRAFGDGLA